MNIKPTSKQTAAGVTGAASILLIWGLSQFGVDMPPEVGAAVAVILAWGAGWVKAERRQPFPPGTGTRRAGAG